MRSIITNDETDLNVAELRVLRPQVEAVWKEAFAEQLPRLVRNLDRLARLCRAEDEGLWRVACHEAGHCLHAWITGHLVRYAAVIEGWNLAGRVRYRADGAESITDRIVGLIAGPMAATMIAEARFALPISEGSDGKRIEMMLMEHESDFTRAAGFARSGLYRDAEHRAREFVEEARQPITLLGVLLCKYRALGHQAIEQALNI